MHVAALRIAGRARAAVRARALVAVWRTAAPLSMTVIAACASGRASSNRAGSIPTPETAVSRADADYLRGRMLMVPVHGVSPERVPDSYNARRGDRQHRALDIMAPRGTPVVAADDGRVFRVSNNKLGGLTVYAVDSDERFIYYYAHLDGYREGLAAGMDIDQGDVLGYVGTTGNAPQHIPHLHFQVMRMRRDRYWDGTPLNPLPFFVFTGLARRPDNVTSIR